MAAHATPFLLKDLLQDPNAPANAPVFEAPRLVYPSQGAPFRYAAPTADTGYSINFTCNEQGLVGFDVMDCPMRVIDGDDLLGNPSLAVDPLNPRHLVFASLHGQSGSGPTNLSRRGQTHTTFTTSALGQSWTDNPYEPPSPPYGDNRVVTGEDAAAIMDDVGNVYVASLYGVRATNDENATWSSAISLWKFDATLDTLTYLFPSGYFESKLPGSMITDMWLLRIPEERRIVLLWHERALGNDTATFGGKNYTSWITGAWTPADLYSPWTPFKDPLVLGPCEDTTNPVIHKKKLYIGCIAEEGYDLIRGVSEGDLLIHRLDVGGSTAAVVSKAPFSGENPWIAINEQGRMALVSLDRVDNTTVRALVSTSRLGEGWSRAWEFGEDLLATRTFGTGSTEYVEVPVDNGTDDGNASGDGNNTTVEEPAGYLPPAPSFNVSHAKINALVYRGATNTLHLIYREQATEEDTDNLDMPLWRKAYVVIDPLGTVLLNMDLDLSSKGDVFQFDDGPGDETVYGDTQDSLLEVNGRLYLAFNDYSAVMIAEVVESDNRPEITPLQGPPPPPPVPAPTVAASTSLAPVGVGVAAGATTAAAVRRIHAARNGAGGGK